MLRWIRLCYHLYTCRGRGGQISPHPSCFSPITLAEIIIITWNFRYLTRNCWFSRACNNYYVCHRRRCKSVHGFSRNSDVNSNIDCRSGCSAAPARPAAGVFLVASASRYIQPCVSLWDHASTCKRFNSDWVDSCESNEILDSFWLGRLNPLLLPNESWLNRLYVHGIHKWLNRQLIFSSWLNRPNDSITSHHI